MNRDPIFGDMSDSDESDDESVDSAEETDVGEKAAVAGKRETEEEEDRKAENGSLSPSDSHPTTKENGSDEDAINLFHYKAAKELEAVGLDGLKVELQRLGLLCGGSLEQRAERLFATKGLERCDWDPALSKSAKKGKRKGKAVQAKGN